MEFAKPLVRGRLLRRYKRFLADVVLEDGAEVVAHCPNPGSMMGLDAPGSAIWLEPNEAPTRKLRYGWRLVELPDGRLAGIDTAAPNRVAGEALRAGLIPEFRDYTSVRPEVRYGAKSRVDFVLSGTGRPDAYVEVKNVHLRRQADLAEFPDCVTLRGATHLRELSEVARSGRRAAMLYVIQRDDCARMALAEDLDPGYAAAFRDARAAGVEALAWVCALSTERITLSHPAPVLEPRGT